MKVSVNWIKSISDQYQTSANLIPSDINKLVEKIGAQLGAVEEVIDVGKKYQGIVVAKVIECKKHPNADKLSVCLIDNGKDKIQVVCGAPNVAAGQLVAWIPPGAAVPNTYDKDLFILEAREIRGVISNGMIASPKELAISDEHEGILVIDKAARSGDSFAELYKMDDFIIDIENKMFTHRPDCFGMLGIARELAGIQGLMFKSPDWYRPDASAPSSRARDDHKLTVKNEIPKLVPRFCTLVIKDVKVDSSPLWLQASLSRVGMKSINNIVDLTNFYMLLTAQPLHAYDYDKVKTGILGIRLSKKGEQLRLLGGKEITLSDGAVVVTDGKKPIGLGGIMGGADTEVDGNTKNIILECANFDMNATRKTAMDYGLFTDAATRFTKNQSSRQIQAVIAKAANDILKLAGGRVSGKLIDDNYRSSKDAAVTLGRDFINSRLGVNLQMSEIKKLLENVEFKVRIKSDLLTVEMPFWRTDIEIAEDIVEEVGRLHGYDRLPQELPSRSLSPAEHDELLGFKARLRKILAAAGGNEVLTYSFVHGSLLEKAGQDPAQTYHIRNALSPDLQYYRPSLIPSLLEKVHPNIKAGYAKFALFEMGKIHLKGVLDEEKLPKEFENLAFVIAGKDTKTGAPYYAAKKYFEYLAGELAVAQVSYLVSQERPPAYEACRSAWLYSGQELLGVLGEPSRQLREALKLPAYTAVFELNITSLMKTTGTEKYRPLNRFPSTDQDITLRSSTDLAYGEQANFLQKQLDKAALEHGYGFATKPLDIYQKPNDRRHKQTSWRLTLWHPDRTLTTGETNKLLDKIAAEAGKVLKSERI